MNARHLIAWLFASAVVGAHSQPANAQVFEDPLGVPMQSVAVPALEPGIEYVFLTDFTLAPLIDGTTPAAVLSLHEGSAASPALAGSAAVCCDPIYPDSCSENAACFTYYAQGSADTQRVLFLRAMETNAPGRTSLWYHKVYYDDPWHQISAPIAFGGGVARTTIASGEKVYFQTLMRPAGPLHHDVITYLWGIDYNPLHWSEANGRVGDTALLDWGVSATAPLPPGTYEQAFGTIEHRANGALVSSDGSGPMGLAEDHPTGTDWDHDGLDAALEHSLGTCDSRDQFPYCATAPGCGTPYNQSLCQASLRDTDHDGLVDPLELFGYDDSKLYLPRFGASPTHLDVFVEMESLDQDPDTSGCQGFETVPPNVALSNGKTDFFTQFDKAYGRAPAYLNADGAPGIRFHFDVGIANPDPTDTRWGDWGGGNKCLGPAPSCLYSECLPGTLSTIRQGIFHQAADYPLVAGGDSGGVAGETYGFVHEFGHIAGLIHEAPGGGLPGLTSRLGYPTVMNYEYKGIFEQDFFDEFSFSFGTWAPVSYRAVPEIAPFGPSANLSILTLPGAARNACQGNGTTACPGTGWNVDWDNSGAYEPNIARSASTSNTAMARRWSLPNPLSDQAPELLKLGNLLVLATAEAGPKVVVRADGDADCSLYGVSSCITFADAVSFSGANSVALAATPLVLNGNSSDGLVVITREGTSLRWSLLTLAPGATGDQVVVGLQSGDLVRDASGNPVVTTSGHQFKPALVKLAGSGGVLLLYANTDGKLMQAVFDPAAHTWSTPEAALDQSGSQLAFDSSVAAITVAGTTVLGGTSRTISTSTIGIVHTYSRVSNHWVDFGSPISNTQLEPPAFSVDAQGSLLVYAGNIDRWAPRHWFSVKSFPDWTPQAPVSDGNSWPLAVVLDDRPNIPAGLVDVRRVELSDPTSFSQTAEFEPFGLYGEPTISGDYNEWYQLKQGFCRAMAGNTAVLPVSSAEAPFVPTPYTTRDCGPELVYPVPCPVTGGIGYCCGSTPVAAGSICP